MARLFLTALSAFALIFMPAAYCAAGTIVVVGDSLSSGYGLSEAPSWVSLLKDRLEAQGYEYDVVNASIAGDTSAGGLARLPRLLETLMPDIVVIEIGGNDGLRGQPVDVLRQNIAKMIRLARDAGARVLLTGIQIPPNYGFAYTEALAGVYRDLAHEFSVPLVEFLMQGIALNDALMQADRMHPNADGQPIMLENVWPVLAELL
jgi:acyl-CoA thioesterase-1